MRTQFKTDPSRTIELEEDAALLGALPVDIRECLLYDATGPFDVREIRDWVERFGGNVALVMLKAGMCAATGVTYGKHHPGYKSLDDVCRERAVSAESVREAFFVMHRLRQDPTKSKPI